MRPSNQRKLLLAAVAATGLSLLTVSVPVGAADPAAQPVSARPAAVQPAALPAGFQMKNVDADSGVKTGLVKLTERAVTKGDFNKFLAELTTPEKKHAREFKGADQAKLDGIIDQIQKDWKAKYGEDFKISDKNLIFDQRFVITQGEVSDPATAVNNWPVAAVAGEAVSASSHENAANDKKAMAEAKAAELTKGRDVALVRFPASHALPEMTVSMLKERIIVGVWRVDVPDSRTGEQIYNDLSAQLSSIRDHRAEWPATVADAYRMVAHHAIAALYGGPMSGTKG
jgi:hypothetical protein